MYIKRVRIGFVCSDATCCPVSADMFPSLCLQNIECALSEGKVFAVLTVDKGVESSDVLKAVDEFNARGEPKLLLEKFGDCQENVVVLEKGQRYMHNPLYLVVQAAKLSPRTEGEPQKFWEWTPESQSVKNMHRKRVVSELVSDLVEESICPAASKRERSSKAETVAEVIPLGSSPCEINTFIYIGFLFPGAIFLRAEGRQAGKRSQPRLDHGVEPDDPGGRNFQVKRRDHCSQGLRHPFARNHAAKRASTLMCTLSSIKNSPRRKVGVNNQCRKRVLAQ
jgi:hypothetical protein